MPCYLMKTFQGMGMVKVSLDLLVLALPLSTFDPNTSYYLAPILTHNTDPLHRWFSPRLLPSIIPSYTLHEFILTHSHQVSKPS